MAMGMKKGDRRSGPRVALIVICSTSVPGAAQTGADDDAGTVGQLALEVLRQAGLVHRLARGHQGELRVAIVAPDLLAVEHLRRVEVLHLAGDLAGHPLRIERGDATNAGVTAHEARPERGHVVAERRHGAHAGDDHAPSRAGVGHRTNLPGAHGRGAIDVPREAACGDLLGGGLRVVVGPEELRRGRGIFVLALVGDGQQRPAGRRLAVEGEAARTGVDDQLAAELAHIGNVGVTARDHARIGARHALDGDMSGQGRSPGRRSGCPARRGTRAAASRRPTGDARPAARAATRAARRTAVRAPTRPPPGAPTVRPRTTGRLPRSQDRPPRCRCCPGRPARRRRATRGHVRLSQPGGVR